MKVFTRRRVLRTLCTLAAVPLPLAQDSRERALDAATIGALKSVGTDEERSFNLRGERMSIVRVEGRSGRASGAWFSYDLPADRSNAVAVVVTYNTALEWFCRFNVSVDGEPVGTEYMPPRQAAEFFDVHYAVPSGIATAKDRITIRFDAVGGDPIAPVFEIRTIRA